MANHCECGAPIGKWNTQCWECEEKANGNDDPMAEVNTLMVGLYGSDPASEHLLPHVEATQPVQESVQIELPEEVIVDGQQEVGSSVSYRGQNYVVTLCEVTTAADYAEDTRNEVEGLNIGWHSWLTKVQE